MAITFNGTTQYVNLGNGTDIYRTRPFTVAALVNTASMRTAGSFNGIMSEGGYTASTGWGMEIEAAASNPRLYAFYGMGAATGVRDNYSTWFIAPNTGWWLVGMVFRTNGSATLIDLFGYRYNTNAFSVNTLTSTSNVALGAPAAGATAAIGGMFDTAIIDFYPNLIDWTAVFDFDIGAGATMTPDLARLISDGPWPWLGNAPGTACQFFMTLSDPVADKLYDLANGSKYIGTLTAAPALSLPYLTEARPNHIPWNLYLAGATVISGGVTTYQLTSSLYGSGQAQVTTNQIRQLVDNLVGTSTLKSTANRSASLRATLVGTGQLKWTTVRAFPLSLNLPGSGKLVVTVVKVLPLTTRLAGTGQLNTTSNLVKQLTDRLTGAGQQKATTNKGNQLNARMQGTGLVFGTPNLVEQLRAGLSGTGQVKATTNRINQLKANLQGSGQLKSTANWTTRLQAALSGSGQLVSRLGTSVLQKTIQAFLAGTGGLKVTTNKGNQLKVSITGSGSVLQSSPTLTRRLQVALSGVGQVSSSIVKAFPLSARLVGQGSARVTTNLGSQLKVRLTGSGNVSSTAFWKATVNAVLSGYGLLRSFIQSAVAPHQASPIIASVQLDYSKMIAATVELDYSKVVAATVTIDEARAVAATVEIDRTKAVAGAVDFDYTKVIAGKVTLS